MVPVGALTLGRGGAKIRPFSAGPYAEEGEFDGVNAVSGEGREKVGVLTASSLVVANMIGTGVFTSLGFQASAIPSPLPLLALWVLGGLAALCGALCYGELGAALPRSGGEYHFLSRIYHPAAGFVSGWLSLTVGFSAPVALAAMAFGAYLGRVFDFSEGLERWAAVAAVLVISGVHILGVRAGKFFQNAFTLAKIALITGFSGCGLLMASARQPVFRLSDGGLGLVASPSFAVCLIFVMYAYSGWNASAYVAGEIASPQKDLHRSLLWGTSLVALLYLLLNFVFLSTTPVRELAGQLEVGIVSAGHIFGPAGAGMMGMLISLGLVSSISAMVWAGPRVAQMIGEDIRFFAPFAATNGAGAPANAILLQLAIVLLLIATSTFEAVLTYLGFTLTLSTSLTVLGVIVLRRREPGLDRPYRAWGYPFTPLIFLTVNGWMLIYTLVMKPVECLWGLATIAAGLAGFALACSKVEVYQR